MSKCKEVCSEISETTPILPDQLNDVLLKNDYIEYELYSDGSAKWSVLGYDYKGSWVHNGDFLRIIWIDDNFEESFVFMWLKTAKVGEHECIIATEYFPVYDEDNKEIIRSEIPDDFECGGAAHPIIIDSL